MWFNEVCYSIYCRLETRYISCNLCSVSCYIPLRESTSVYWWSQPPKCFPYFSCTSRVYYPWLYSCSHVSPLLQLKCLLWRPLVTTLCYKSLSQPCCMLTYYKLGSSLWVWSNTPFLCGCSQTTPFLCGCGQTTPFLCGCGQTTPFLCGCGQTTPFLCECGQTTLFLCGCFLCVVYLAGRWPGMRVGNITQFTLHYI